MSDQHADYGQASDRVAEHLSHLADRLIGAAGALPSGEPWVQVSAVAMELSRLSRLFAGVHNHGAVGGTDE